MQVSHVYSGIATTGVQTQRLATPGGEVFAKHAIQVKGTGAAPDAWSVTYEGSLDDTNWTILATHAATDGATVMVVDKPVTHLRVNVGTLTLGATATAITVTVVSAP